jgi:hypothetical protein
MEYGYTYRGMQMTNPSGLRTFLPRFLGHCRGPAVGFVYLSIECGDEKYGFESLDEMLSSPVLDRATEIYVHVNVKSGEKLELAIAAYPTEAGRVRLRGIGDDAARTLVRCAQEDLGIQPVPVKPAPDRSVFLAHSFDEAGKQAAGVVRELLELLGFRVVTGEAYSPRGVSSKIKDRIREQGVAVCVLTKRRGADGQGRTSQWVLDEATVAEALEKPLFLLMEKGVEAELGIHGDREYIRFTMASLHDAMIKLLQGLRELGYQFEPEP